MTEIILNSRKNLSEHSLTECVGFIIENEDEDGELMCFIVLDSYDERKTVVNLSSPTFETSSGYTIEDVCLDYDYTLIAIFNSMKDFKLTVSLGREK